MIQEDGRIPINVEVKPEFTSNREGIYAGEIIGTIGNYLINLVGGKLKCTQKKLVDKGA